MKRNKASALAVVALFLVLTAVVLAKNNLLPGAKNAPNSSPTASLDPQSSVTWEEGKKLIAGCKVQQTIELHSGILRLELTDGTAKSIMPYSQDELYQVVQSVPAKCGFSIVIAIE